MDDMASVGLQVDSRPVRTASDDLDKFAGAGDRAGGSAGRAEGAFAGMGKGLAVAAASAVAAAVSIVALSAQFNRFIDATVEAEKVQAQLGAALASTGGAAGKSVDDLNRHAAALQKVTNFGDEAINSMQGLLLTFTQVRGDQFDAATKATLDLATAMGTDLNSAALQVGKALNDPVLGMTALSRSGIQFTEAQKEMVKGMVAANDTIGAQTIILAELEKQFGGSAEAARNTLGGALASLRNAFGDLFELSGPGAKGLRDAIESLTKVVSDPAFFAAVQAIGTGLFAAAEMGINALTMLLPVITAVVENIDVIAYSSGIAAAVFAGPYVAAMGAAVIATFSLTGALGILKTALITTGVGALIVGAGYLVAMFGRLVKAAGGFGEAMRLVADVAVDAWQRIGLGVEFIGQSVAAMSANIQAFFLSAIKVMAGAFVDLTWVVADGLNALFGSNLQGASAVITQELGKAQVAAEDLASAATSAATAAKDGFSAPMESIQALRDAMTQSAIETEGAAVAADQLNNSLGETGGGAGSGGAAGKAAKEIKKVATEAEAFNIEMTEAEKAVKAYADAIEGMVVSGIGRAVDWMVDGFKGGFKGLLNIAKDTLKQIIAFYLKNRVMLSLGIGGGGVGGATQALAGAAGGGGPLGMLGNLGSGGGMLGGIGGVLGTIGSNFGAGFMTSVYGGLGGLTGAVSGGLSVGGLAGISTAIGAIAAPLLAVVAVVSFFKKKTKELDAGLKLTVNGMGTLVQTFKTIETKRFWGLSKKVRTSFQNASDEIANPLIKAVGEIQGGIVDAAALLGIAGSTFGNFAHTINVSTKGMSDADAQKAVTDAFVGLGDAFAGMIPGLQALQKDGEGAMVAISRLAQSLTVVNDVFQSLGFSAYGVSLAGAAAADTFASLFGSLDNFAASTAAYYDAFYTGEEKRADATSRLAASLAALGVSAIPQDRAAFRGLVDSAQLAGNIDLAAGLIMLSPAFAGLTQAVENFNAVSQSYYQNFFTDAERIARATELLSIEMLALGIDTLPATRAAFRALVDEADALGDSGLVASLMQLSPAFAEISAGADALGDSLRSLVNEDLFATGVDFMRGTSRASNGIEYTPERSSAEMLAELKALNARIDRLQSTSEFTAAYTGQTANNTEGQLTILETA